MLEGNKNPKDSHFPEDWIASTTRAVNVGREQFVNEGLSEVSISNETYILAELLKKHPNEMLGPEHVSVHGKEIPFLLKYLDSSVRLHIQVHPTIEFSRTHLDSNHGKTEAYVILEVREEINDPYILLGFQHPISKQQFKKAVAEQDIDTMLGCFEKISVAPGDVFMVPGGIPHAIGPGVLMVEIMEPTDFVARLEFERGGYTLPEKSRFMDRGIDFGMAMIEFRKKSKEDVKKDHFCQPRLLKSQSGGKLYNLIDERYTTCFRVDRLVVDGRYRNMFEGMHIGIVTKGSGRIVTISENFEVSMGSRFLIPYHTSSVTYEAKERMEILIVSP